MLQFSALQRQKNHRNEPCHAQGFCIQEQTLAFETLGLRSELLQAIAELGYEEATPIQVQSIPALLEGRDVLGQAQTGTGKTAAFALPMLNNMDLTARGVQALVMVPTRELAVQVSEAIHSYGHVLGARVLPVYGGASYGRQLGRLEKGVHVVVGTPGRVIDLIDRGALDLSHVRYLVLDEADEMLDMGFVDDVEKILKSVPTERQTALFSATLPEPIRRLSERYMHNPVVVTIAPKQVTVPQIEQRYYFLHEQSKLPALVRILEVEDIHSALVFTRTKMGAAELAEKLLNRGYSAEALHGDLSQDVREIVLRRFRNGHLKILVATDVVARGVDIQGVSHVINFDVPYDPEDYVHRIGRTGRAGRSGIAISLVTPFDGRRLKNIEHYIKQQIPRAKLPEAEVVYARRDALFAANLETTLNEDDLSHELAMAQSLIDSGLDPLAVAAAAIRLARADEANRPVEDVRELRERDDRRQGDRRGDRRGDYRSDRGDRGGFRSERGERGERGERRDDRPRRGSRDTEPGMVRLRMDLGRAQGIRPGDVVGAIAGEAGIPGRSIGAIDIHDQQTFVDVQEHHVERVLHRIEGKRAKLRGMPFRLTRVTG
jgi:ATP-dependent RNA helicase DeaD